MSRLLTLAAVLLLATPLAADEKDKDWTGKLVMLRPYNASLGKPGVVGLELNDKRLGGDNPFTVRAEKGEFLVLQRSVS